MACTTIAVCSFRFRPINNTVSKMENDTLGVMMLDQAATFHEERTGPV
jgi:hypothetical protein